MYICILLVVFHRRTLTWKTEAYLPLLDLEGMRLSVFFPVVSGWRRVVIF